MFSPTFKARHLTLLSCVGTDDEFGVWTACKAQIADVSRTKNSLDLQQKADIRLT